ADGYEPDGNITVGELAKFVRKEQHRLAVENGKSDDEKNQTPVVLEAQVSDFIISHNPVAHPQAMQRLGKFDKLARDQNLEKGLAEEGHNLLERMPKLEAQQNLRKAYQKLADSQIDFTAFRTERKSILDTTIISEKDAGSYARMVINAAKVVRQG